MIEETGEKRQIFGFMRSYLDCIEKCPERAQLALFRAVVRYGLNEESPDFSEHEDSCFLEAIWSAILPNLQSNHKKSQDGKKGGAPKGSRNNPFGVNQYSKNKPVDNQRITNGKPEDNQKQKVDKQIEIEVEIEKEIKEEIIKKKRFDFLSELTHLGVSQQTASDFMEVRKQKKATNTQTAFNRIKSEINKAMADGVTAEECIAMAVENSWQGFCYDWYQKRTLPTKQEPKAFTKPEYGTEQKKVITGPNLLRIYG